MKKTFIISIVLLSFLFSEINAQKSYIVKRGERPPIDLQSLPDDAYEKGFIKIKLDESFTNQMDNTPVFVNENGIVSFDIADIDELNHRFGAKSFKKTFESKAFSSEFSDRHRAWGFHLWYTLYFDEKTDIKELVNAYDRLSGVTIAEPQYKTELYDIDPTDSQSKTDINQGGSPMDWTPNDPSYGVQWHYHNTGQQSGTVDADIDLPEAWNLETGNSSVIVSVHDMGIQHTHPDIIGNMWSGIGWDFYNDDATIEAGYHGTHVGGTVSAESNNGIGVAGVAGGTGSNNGVRLMTCMVYHPTIGGGVGHHLAPVFAADNGACIEQNSWGYTNPGAYDQAVLDAIDYFNLNGGGTALSGGITIYAAGNSNSSGAYYPGYYSGTLAVAATNNQDIRSYYSNYGSWVDIAAPGGETHIVTARGVYSTYTGSSYGYLQGTSMACPHVSGVAALIVSNAYGLLTNADVKAILISSNSVDDIDALNPTYAGLLGSGRTNAYKALLETQNYLATPGDMMPLPPHSTTNTGNVRGYWYQAPTDFTISGLRVPTDVVGNQTIEIIRFNSGPPPVFSGTTNDFVSLGRWVNVAGSGIISCNIPVASGDYIGILGCRGTITSYGSPNPYSTTIDGNPVTLTRMGMQFPLTTNLAQDIWQEPTGTYIGRIEMYYEKFSTWTGLVNTSWTNAGNWSGLYVPNQYNDVVIPSGCPNYPVLGGSLGINTGTYTYDCKSLNINPGATVTLTGSSNVYNYGELIVGGSLSIGNDFYLYSGSTVDLTGTISIGTAVGWYGDAVHNSGSVFNQTSGNYYVENLTLSNGSQFNGTAGSTHIAANGDTPPVANIQIDDPDSYFYYFYVDAGANAVLFDCAFDLEAYVTILYGPLNVDVYTLNSTYMDAYTDGNLTINSGGTVNVTGNGPYFHSGAALTMVPGSELNSGLNIQFQLGSTENVTGGEIFLEGNFTDADNIFSPTAGSVTFDEGSTGYIYGPTTFYNLYVDKTGGVKSSSQNANPSIPINYSKENLDGPASYESSEVVSSKDDTKANLVNLSGNVYVANELTINNGELRLNGYELTVTYDCRVHGILTMDNPADILNVGATFGDRLWFHPGSIGNLSEGVANIYGWFQPEAGCSVTGSLNHTTVFKGVTGGGPNNFEPSATYGNIEIFKNPGQITFISGQASQPIVANGNLIVHPDNQFVLLDKTMIVHGSVIDNSSSSIYVYTADKDGSTVYSGDNPKDIGIEDVTISTEKEESATDTGAKGGFLEIDNAFTLTGLLDVGDGDVYLHGGFSIATTGILNIDGGTVIDDAPYGTDDWHFLNGSFNITDGLFEITNNSINFGTTAMTNVSGGILRTGGAFYGNYTGTFQPTGGLVEIIGANPDDAVYCSNGNYFYNLLINRDPSYNAVLIYETTIQNNLTINSGNLVAWDDLYVGGNWTNNVGPTGFEAGTGIVHFNGNGPTQFVNGETSFYNIHQDYVAPGSYLQFVGPTTVMMDMVLNYFTWVNNTFDLSGTLDLNNTSSKFTANGGGVATIDTLDQGGTVVANGGEISFMDVVEAGIFGTISVINGTLNYFQDAGQFPDINATIIISDGVLNVSGGAGGNVWAFAAPTSITMSGGAFNLSGNSVSIGAPFTENITGGIITFDRSFSASSTDFTPTGGTVLMTGGLDAELGMTPGANFFNVEINKSGGDKSVILIKDRDGTVIESTKANSTALSSNLDIHGDLIVEEGDFFLDGFTLNNTNSVIVNDGGILNVNANSTLNVGGGYGLYVNSGGYLYALGSSGNEPVIQALGAGYYDFHINSGGIMGAEYAIFEGMGADGVFLNIGSFVDPLYPFNYCTFQNGTPGYATLFNIATNQSFTCTGANFPDASSSQFNTFKYSGSTGQTTFLNPTGVFAGPAYELDPSDQIHWTVTPYDVDLKVYLEGPYNTGSNLMNLDLYIGGYIPLSQPYFPTLPYYGNSSPTWLYLGGESVGSIPANVVDWVVVQLRDANTAANASSAARMGTKAGFLLEDGSIVDLDGVSLLQFDAFYADNIYAVVYHRNHLGIMSNYGLTESGGNFSYDYSTGVNQVFGGTSGHKQLEPGIWGMVAADGDADGSVLPSDKTSVWLPDVNLTGYRGGDYNMNGIGQPDDMTNFWLPNTNKAGQIPAKGVISGYQSQIPE